MRTPQIAVAGIANKMPIKPNKIPKTNEMVNQFRGFRKFPRNKTIYLQNQYGRTQ